jgi:hypothetical protein
MQFSDSGMQTFLSQTIERHRVWFDGTLQPAICKGLRKQTCNYSSHKELCHTWLGIVHYDKSAGKMPSFYTRFVHTNNIKTLKVPIFFLIRMEFSL